MPDEIQYDASSTPAQFTNNADIVIEQGTHVRVKIIGLRTEVGDMWAIGSINGDFLGYVLSSRATEQRQRGLGRANLFSLFAAVCKHRGRAGGSNPAVVPVPVFGAVDSSKASCPARGVTASCWNAALRGLPSLISWDRGTMPVGVDAFHGRSSS